MILSLIVAVDLNNAIGFNNELVCKVKDDMEMFKRVTEGAVLILGRKTYQSIGKPLSTRVSIVISNTTDWITEKEKTYIGLNRLYVVSSLDYAINLAKDITVNDETFIIGGSGIYNEAVERDLVDRFFITLFKIEAKNADTYFPTDRVLNNPKMKPNLIKYNYSKYEEKSDTLIDLSFNVYSCIDPQNWCYKEVLTMGQAKVRGAYEIRKSAAMVH